MLKEGYKYFTNILLSSSINIIFIYCRISFISRHNKHIFLFSNFTYRIYIIF